MTDDENVIYAVTTSKPWKKETVFVKKRDQAKLLEKYGGYDNYSKIFLSDDSEITGLIYNRYHERYWSSLRFRGLSLNEKIEKIQEIMHNETKRVLK